MALRSAYNWRVETSLCDHTAMFNARFSGRRFCSYREFQDELRKFEEECLVLFRIRSSARSVPGDPCVYRHLRMICTYGNDDKPSESVGIRHRRSKCRGCPARFMVNGRSGHLVVGPRSRVLVHNHRASELEYRLEPAVRRLNSEQRSEVMRLLQYGFPTNYIRRMAPLEYHKYLTPWDVNNMKGRMVDTAVPAASWADLEDLVHECGNFSCTRNNASRTECISFCRREQADLFGRYPEVVCMDATYNVNRSRFCLVQFIITDGLGRGRCVMYSLMRNERSPTYVTALLDLRNMMPDTNKLRTCVVDLSFAHMKAIKTVFPREKILFCHFHMITAVYRKSKDKLVRYFFRHLMKTWSVFSRVWLRHSRAWAACYRSGTVCLGNQTDNRAESAHRWLKRDLYRGDSLFNCCKRIWLCSHQMLVDFLRDVALSRMRRPVVTFNNPLAGLVGRMTRYAAERMLKELDSAKGPMAAVGVGWKFRVMEQMCARRMTFDVNLSQVSCSCMFYQFHAMPCRHLVFACMKAKVPIGDLVARNRWLNKNLDGVGPPEVTFCQVPPPQSSMSEEVRLMRRARQLRRTLSPNTHRIMLDKTSTLWDALEVFDLGATNSDSLPDEIPPLRQRISELPPRLTTATPLTAPTTRKRKHTQSSAAFNNTPLYEHKQKSHASRHAAPMIRICAGRPALSALSSRRALPPHQSGSVLEAAPGLFDPITTTSLTPGGTFAEFDLLNFSGVLSPYYGPGMESLTAAIDEVLRGAHSPLESNNKADFLCYVDRLVLPGMVFELKNAKDENIPWSLGPGLCLIPAGGSECSGQNRKSVGSVLVRQFGVLKHCLTEQKTDKSTKAGVLPSQMHSLWLETVSRGGGCTTSLAPLSRSTFRCSASGFNVGDRVIGVVKRRMGDYYAVDIGCASLASISYLAFEGASKKNRPDINSGDVLFAVITQADRDLEIELSCMDEAGKASGMGILGRHEPGVVGNAEGMAGGVMLHCTPDLVRRLGDQEKFPLLSILSKTFPFEVCLGANGRIWLTARSPRETTVLANMIALADHISPAECCEIAKTIY